MLRFAEELMLLLLDNENGEFIQVPNRTMQYALAGAVLMDLALEYCIDTDLEQLILLDPTPVGDDLLDPTLADIAQETNVHDIGFWVERAKERADSIREKALARLSERGILEVDEGGFVSLTLWVSRARRYPISEDKVKQEVMLRIMGVLFTDDIPEPRDVVLICLVDACKILARILSRSEYAEAEERIEQVRQMDLIGQSVSRAIQKMTLDEEPEQRRVASKALPPRAPGLPLVGNAFSMMGDIRSFLTKQYLQLGPIFSLQALDRTFIVLAGPEANLFLARQGKTHLRSREFWMDFTAELGTTRLVIGMDGGEHFRLRRALKRGYSRSYITSHLATAIDIAQREIAEWPLNVPLAGLYSLQRIIIEQLGVLCTNTSPREYLNDLIPFFDSLLLSRLTHHRPRLFMYTPRLRRARKRVHALYEHILALHETSPGNGREPDLIDDLLDLHHNDPQFMPETDLIGAVLGPFIAGLDTSAGISAFTLYALLKHPELLAPTKAEADALFAGGIPTSAALHKLDVIPRVAMEALRMYPIAPALRRTVSNSFEFAGYRIPAGTHVIIATTVPHYLPEYFPNPERFDIDRYTAERREHKQPGVYAPFGLGPHRCLGNGFAEVQIAVTLATILHKTELQLEPPNYELKVRQAPLPKVDKSFKFRLLQRR